MTNQINYSLKIQDVHKLALQFLCELTLLSAGITRVKDILNVVILAVTFRTSINQACSELQGVPSASYVLRQLTDQFHDVDQLEKELNKVLISKLPKQITDKKRRVAIDVVDIPFHGTTKNDSDVRRSYASSGTTHFFSYATAYVIWKGNRYTLALVRVLAEDNMLDVLKKLNAALKEIGVKISVLLLDRAFYSVKVIRYLKRRKQAFIMPAIKRGKKANQEGGPTGTQQLAALKKSGRTRYTLGSQTDGQVS
jgi:putative transposase